MKDVFSTLQILFFSVLNVFKRPDLKDHQVKTKCSFQRMPFKAKQLYLMETHRQVQTVEAAKIREITVRHWTGLMT